MRATPFNLPDVTERLGATVEEQGFSGIKFYDF